MPVTVAIDRATILTPKNPDADQQHKTGERRHRKALSTTTREPKFDGGARGVNRSSSVNTTDYSFGLGIATPYSHPQINDSGQKR